MATLTVQPSAKDTRMHQYNNTTNYGSETTFNVVSRDTFTPHRNQRSILEFDISALPTGAIISAAVLSLYALTIADTAGRTYWAYKLTRTDWVEAQATWNIYKAGSNWTAGGGDYVTTNPSGGSAVVPASAAWMDFNVLAIVQDAYSLSNPAEFLIRDGTEDYDDTFRNTAFYSKEEAVQTTRRPKLVIEYTAPTPVADGDLIGIAVIRRS